MVKSQQMNKAKYTLVNRSEKSANEQGYTATARTVVKSQQMNKAKYTRVNRSEKSADEQGYIATG